MNDITPEQQEDINVRAEEFKKRHMANVEELEVDFISYPQFVQRSDGTFGVSVAGVIVDKKYTPVPSPLQEDTIISE